MSEQDFFEKMEALYNKNKKLHKSTIRVVVIVAGIVVTFGGIVLVQGFETTKAAAELTSKVQMVSDTQTLMYDLNEGKFEDVNRQIDDVKKTQTANKEELQRQLDLIMRDRKLTYRGSDPNIKTNTPK